MSKDKEINTQINVSSKERLVKSTVLIITSSVIFAFLIKIFSIDDFENTNILNAKFVLEFAVLVIVFIYLLSVLEIYIYKNIDRRQEGLDINPLKIVLFSVGVCLIFSVLAVRLINVYVMPLSMAALLVATLIDKKLGIISNILINQAVLISYMLIYQDVNILQCLISVLCGTLSGIIMIIFMQRSFSRMKFLTYGSIIGIAVAPLAILSSILIRNLEWQEILKSGLWALVANVTSVCLFMLVLPLFERGFRIFTNFRLYEICSYENPLLKRLSKEAQGTFNHCLVVGNLAEQCASAIGENPQLARACALYHDVGKLSQPEMFIENQKGYNPHDDLIPEVSVTMIKKHVKDGFRLIKQYNLPDILAKVALEHHGTTAVKFFYNKVKNITEDIVEEDQFKYDGPVPSSKVSAIIMIADTVEAATRAMYTKLQTSEDLKNLIYNLIKDKALSNQFSNSKLTFLDLDTIINTLTEIIPGIFHERINYNKK